MNEKELAKLKLDISLIDECLKEKWLPLLKNEVEYSATDCALCKEYKSDFCPGCPISDDTEKSLCNGTPYDDAYTAVEDREYGWPYEKRHIQAEVDYLKELRAKLEAMTT